MDQDLISYTSTSYTQSQYTIQSRTNTESLISGVLKASKGLCVISGSGDIHYH